MAQTIETELHSGLEERIMKATGLTKNVVCKMLCDANDTEDEFEKQRILSHIIWHMPVGQLAQSDAAKEAKKVLLEDIANEIGTVVPSDILSSLTIEVADDTDNEGDDETDNTANTPVETTPTVPVETPKPVEPEPTDTEDDEEQDDEPAEPETTEETETTK